MMSLESMKKSRVDEDDDGNDGDDMMVPIDTDSIICRAVPKPIIADEFIIDIPLRDVFIGILKNKRDIAMAIKFITGILPGFSHLKRCANGQLILAYVDKSMEQLENNFTPSFTSAENLKQFLTDNNFNLDLFHDNFIILPVPECTPRTKLQAKNASKIWPVNFHPDHNIELIMNGKFFNTIQLDIIDKCMEICIEASISSAFGNNYCNGSAVILDPNDNGTCRIIAIASCRINEHPMWHSVMLAIDLIAKYRGGGAWKFKSTHDTILNNKDNYCKRKFPVNSTLCYPLSLNHLNIPIFNTNSINNINNDNENNISYLCTNYWIFLLQEPCPLCAMALLHSRISMIFYGVKNESYGILGSNALLHTMPGVNHRYKVWTNILSRDCQIAMKKINQHNVTL